MAKKNSKKLGMALIGIIFLALVYMLFWYTPATQPINVGDDFPAEMRNGQCVGREGADIGLCCAIWNEQDQSEDWVLCDSLITKQKTAAQAFFSFNEGDQLANIARIATAIEVTNTGNTGAEIALTDVEVVAQEGGDVNAINEIQTAFINIPGYGQYDYIGTGASKSLSMLSAKSIRVDIPGGASPFVMADGLYKITLEFTAKDSMGASQSFTKTFYLRVEQEQLSFQIDVSAA